MSAILTTLTDKVESLEYFLLRGQLPFTAGTEAIIALAAELEKLHIQHGRHLPVVPKSASSFQQTCFSIFEWSDASLGSYSLCVSSNCKPDGN